MLRTYDLNLIPIFDALMREKNLTKAANSLGMSQPAVSNALKRLRLTLKDDLFVRSGGGLKPTERAIELHDAVSPALELIEQGLEGQDFAVESFDREVNISMDAVVEYAAMPGLLKLLRPIAPLMRINVFPDNLRNIPDRLKDGRLHYAIEYSSLPEQHFDHLSLASDSLVVICAANHPVLSETISLQQYETLPHVSLVPRVIPGALPTDVQSSPVDFVIGRGSPPRNIQVRVSNFFGIPSIVAGTDMIAIVASRLAQPFVEQGLLRALPVPFEYPEVQYRLYWHKSRSNSPAHKWLLDVFQTIADGFLD